ncbi:MAG: four helix bundle protein [Verrucomicrobiales bacterium]|nr:four helix bundle protein [Verrucomicrobiales bacterium]MCP5527525.1 four helix bundle protein [Verrucomicrobiales bacterium]
MKYSEWLGTVPVMLAGDSLWKMEAYRLALFAADVGWHDVTKLTRDKRTPDLASQLYRSVGSIGANLSEGYSRGTGRDRARFYEYALGSAREARTWYFNGRHVLGDVVTDHRMKFLTQVIRLILTMIPQQRGHILREEPIPYNPLEDQSSDQQAPAMVSPALLENAPIP